MQDSVRISRNTIYSAIGVIIILILIGGYFYWYAPMEKKKKDMLDYKKAVYESVVCQYSCPAVDVKFQNQTQLLPDPNCIKICTDRLKTTKLNMSAFTTDDLLKDNLFFDLDTVIRQCKTDNMDNSTGGIDNTAFFKCSANNVSMIKDKYDYLN
ncbi:MAG: hypothetical protein Q7S74_05865 [Nanoarchaeota archaeon]|nr:hypothetical protein [Nanoarchaeota archaeon]